MVYAENVLDVIAEAEKCIVEKYPDRESIAQKTALKGLEKIAESEMTDEEKIKEIRSKYFSDSSSVIQQTQSNHSENVFPIYVSDIKQKLLSGLELVSIDMTNADCLKWTAQFSVTQNGRKKSQFAGINNKIVMNEKDTFVVTDIGIDDETQEPVVFLQRNGKEGKIACFRKRRIYEPVFNVRFINITTNNLFTCLVGNSFSITDSREGKKTYKVISADPNRMEAVIEQNDSTHTIIKVYPKPQITSSIVFRKKLSDDLTPSDLEQVQNDARNGNAESQYFIGEAYFDGIIVRKNEFEAVKWYQKAAEQGEKEAQFMLAECLFNGWGITKSIKDAVTWYRKAAEQGLSEAQLQLGVIFFEGKLVKVDYAESAKWFRKLADQENPYGYYFISLCYQEGKGVEQDGKEAVRWCRKAAEQGIVEAQVTLGDHYLNGDGVKKDKTEAVKWYRKASEQNDITAQIKLGDCYLNGDGVTKNGTEAAKWYRKGAEKGDAFAQYKLGAYYYYNTTKDRSAFDWLLKSAQQDNADAQYLLGCCYHGARGIDQDLSLCLKWWTLAAEQGQKDAQRRIEDWISRH